MSALSSSIGPVNRRLAFTRAALAACALVGLGAGTGSMTACETAETKTQDPRPVLAALATNVVVPAWKTLDDEAEGLKNALAEVSRAPSDASVEKARQAFISTRGAWKRTEAFRVGPAEIDTWKSSIDFWPASADAVAKATSNPKTSTKEGVESLGANAKGFMAIEYLLFDSANANASVLPSFTTAPDAQARRGYLAALGEVLRGDAAKFYDLWNPAGKNLAKELAEGSGFFVSAKVATDQLVRQACFTSIAIESTRLGKPLGRQNGGTPVPAAEESPRSDGSIRDLDSALAGLSAIYRGVGEKDDLGLDDLVRAKNPTVDEHVVRDLDATRASIAEIPPPLRLALTRDPGKVQAAFDASKKLKNTLATELVSALGTTLTFSDSDGD